jgi:hypothetical protein
MELVVLVDGSLLLLQTVVVVVVITGNEKPGKVICIEQVI